MGSQLSFSSKQANDASHRFNDFGVHLYNAHSALLWRKFPMKPQVTTVRAISP